ncbi:MAG: 50S ribosomal protein L37ae [Candidatus Micrarchaeota archaeon]|nr:50S ribosomal protein L37ae [Candidatus Micrarchaeota archaeon]
MANKSVRYGSELRKRADKVDQLRRSLFQCPACGKKKVKRQGNSIWACKSCGKTFAGGAYTLTTPAGEIAARSVAEHEKK